MTYILSYYQITENALHCPFEKDLRCLAKVLEKEERADAFINWYENYKDQLADRIDDIPMDERLRVYGESNHHNLFAAMPNSGIHYAITLAGGMSIRRNSNLTSGFSDVDPEWVLAEDPQAIVISATMGDWPPGIALDYRTPENATASLNQYLK